MKFTPSNIALDIDQIKTISNVI